jgi:tetratricopeptide (TPR) repeat protein
LDYESPPVQHLQTTLEECIGAFGDSVELVFLTDDPTRLKTIASQFDANLIPLPFHQLCSGLDSLFPEKVSGGNPKALPSSSGAPITLNDDDQRWLKEELDILYLHTGLAPPESLTLPGEDFIRGAEIGWYDLNINADVERDKMPRVQDQLDSDLRARRTSRVNLYHLPGAGGTTVGRRLLWNLHWKHACALLRRTHPVETAERLFRITSLTGHGLLLLVDGGDIAEKQVDELYDRLRSRHIPVVMLQVLRRFSAQTEGLRAFNLYAQLSSAEANRFATRYSSIVPAKRQVLLTLAGASASDRCIPFYFGLQAFGAGFLGLQSYVEIRLKGIQSNQLRIVGFLALAHHYGQRSLPAQAFANLLGLPPNRPVDLSKAIPPQAMELLVESPKGLWRTAHDILALEILKQLLAPLGGDKRLWKQQLSAWGRAFVEFCRGHSTIPSEEMLEAVRRVFIYRDNSEMLGTEKAGTNHFAQLIEEIPSQEGAADVLRKLTEHYPEETHFWAHLGRYLSIRIHDFTGALGSIDKALSLEETDHVLHHMKGMALRKQVYELIANKISIDEIIKLAIEASTAFSKARELNPDDEHGYISEVQMITKVINYAGQTNSASPISHITSQSGAPFLRESLDRAEDLLESVRKNREGGPASPYEEECRASLDTLYGNTEQALQRWDALLTRQDVYGPPVRRQIIWTYLARRKRAWDNLKPNEISRAVQLLEENLKEEPNKDENLKLWIQAVRRIKNPQSIEAIIERISYWRTAANSLDSIYYLYVLHSLRVFENSKLDREPALRFLDECKNRAQFRRYRTTSPEWLGSGAGIGRLVHYSLLGEWSTDTVFWLHAERLSRVRGRIAKIDAPQAGQLELECGLPAFFVPARGNYSKGRSENRLVTCYIGFSYDGIRAWEVKDAE